MDAHFEREDMGGGKRSRHSGPRTGLFGGGLVLFLAITVGMMALPAEGLGSSGAAPSPRGPTAASPVLVPTPSNSHLWPNPPVHVRPIGIGIPNSVTPTALYSS